MGDDVNISVSGALSMSPANLENLKRPQLQRLCKQLGLRAAGKNVELIAELSKHCTALASSSKQAAEVKSPSKSPKQPSQSRGRKRKAAPLTPPDSPREPSPEPEPSSPPKSKKAKAQPSASANLKKSGKSTKGRGRQKKVGKRGKRTSVEQNEEDESQPLSPERVVASPRKQITPKSLARSRSPASKERKSPAPKAATPKQPTPQAAHRPKASKRAHDDTSPALSAKRRKLAASPALPMTSPVSQPKKLSRSSPNRSSVSLARRKVSSGGTQSRGQASPQKSTAAAKKSLSPPKGRQSTGKTTTGSANKKASSSAGSQPVRKRSSIQASRLSSSRKRSSPIKASSTAKASPKRPSSRRASAKRSPATEKLLKAASPALAQTETSPRSVRRLTFTKKSLSPSSSPGPSKDELKASLLAELDVRVSSKLPAAGVSSKIPRFQSGTTSQAGGASKTASGKNWERIHKSGFNKMKSIADHVAEREKRLESLASSKKSGRGLAEPKRVGSVSFAKNVPDGRPSKPTSRASLVCSKPSGVTAQKKTPSRPSMPAAGARTSFFKPPANVSAMSFNFGGKTPGNPTTTPGKGEGKPSPFRFGATPNKTTVTPKPKFDLKASLQRPLSYKPHTGPLNRHSTAKTSPQPVKPSGIPRRLETYKKTGTKTMEKLRTEQRRSIQNRQKLQRDQNLLARRGLL